MISNIKLYQVDMTWNSLAQNQCVNNLEEANLEPQPLSNLHQDWLSPEEQKERKIQVNSNKVMRKINKSDRDNNISENKLHVVSSGFDEIPEVEEASD